jgi:prolyl 4-hydroxylase
MADLDAAGSLVRAARWDAAGSHGEAINELARGASAGDAHCARMLGLRLLVGDRAPLMPEAGLRLLGEACDRGLGEAAARAAGILALGVRTPPDWPQALAWLTRSAVAGWQPARDQLLALCEDRDLAARAASAQPVQWRDIAAGVALEAWHAAPPPRVLSDEPRICVFTDFLRDEVCALLVSLARGRLEPARIYDAARRVEVVDAHRSNTAATFHVDTVELVHVLLQARMAAACGVGERSMEPPAVLHYSPGQQIHDHYDFVNPESTPDYAGELARNGQRIITFLVYLNEDYDGGDTDFPRLGLRHKGRRGEGLYFANARADLTPEYRMLHAGRPPVRGEKWIVSQFVRSRPMR